jgi:hypothetical protein
MRIVLDDETSKENQLKRLRHHLELYFEGIDDPLNCEPACRVSEIEENPSCDKCINEFIDSIIDSLDKRNSYYF